MAELSLAGVDLEAVLFRLTRYAQGLFGAWRVLGLEPVDVAFAGGEGPDDLAMGLITRFLDPNDASVRWASERGTPTTEGLYALLKAALWHDFLDLKKSKRYTTTVSEDAEVGEQTGLTLDQLRSYLDTPEGTLLKRERQRAIIAEFSEDPKAQEIVKLQLDPDGYNAFTNEDLAQLLDTSVVDIENRKKRVKTRLLRILRSEGETAHA